MLKQHPLYLTDMGLLMGCLLERNDKCHLYLISCLLPQTCCQVSMTFGCLATEDPLKILRGMISGEYPGKYVLIGIDGDSSE